MGIKMRLNSGERVNAALFIAERSVACGFQAAAAATAPPPSVAVDCTRSVRGSSETGFPQRKQYAQQC